MKFINISADGDFNNDEKNVFIEVDVKRGQLKFGDKFYNLEFAVYFFHYYNLKLTYNVGE